MECNNEYTSDTDDVYLEGNFFFHSLFLLPETEIFDRSEFAFFTSG